MSDDEFKAIALMIIGMMAIIAIYPQILELRGTVEPFSELGILGPNKKLGDYPKEIGQNQTFNLYIYIGNHEGKSEYFKVIAKLSDQNSTINDIDVLDAPILNSWEIIIRNEENATIPIQLSLPNVGLNQRIVFELYKLDADTQSFIYHQRWTQLWINVYRSGG